jgi:hypothetical protein
MTPIPETYERRPWSQEDDAELLALLTGPKRLSAKTIGWQIERGADSVCTRASELGYKTGLGTAGRLRRYNPQTIAKIGEWRSEGLSFEEIGKRLGRSESSIRDLCKKKRLSAPPKWTDEESQQALTWYQQGKTGPEIAKEMNRTVRSIYAKVIPNKTPKVKPPVQCKASHEECVIRSKLAHSLRRSRDRKWQCDITYEWVIERLTLQNGRCYYTGLPINYVRNSGDIISLDRLDSSKPYTCDNVVICTWDANRMKQNLGMERFAQLCKYIADLHFPK